MLPFSLVTIVTLSGTSRGEPIDVAALVKTINSVGPHGAGHRAAITAWARLAQADAERLPEILAGMDQAGKLSVNWIRGVVETIAQRQLDRGAGLPQAALETFLSDPSHSPLARRTAYELILLVDPSAKSRFIPGMLNDPSLELRRDAVAHALAEAAKLLDAGRKQDASAAFRTALTAARDLDQIQAASGQLRALGQSVNLPRHFGFLLTWKLAGPFDNTNDRGFDLAYGPEARLDLKAEYQGKTGPVKWSDYTTDDEYGMLDLNKALGKHMGAVAYAYAELVTEAQRDAELRLGCTNANKLWLNGELLTANHVYHSGSQIDQYVGRGRLKAGRNVILVKVAQNEQTDSWAQNWQFQLRVCDQTGTAILSADRR